MVGAKLFDCVVSGAIFGLQLITTMSIKDYELKVISLSLSISRFIASQKALHSSNVDIISICLFCQAIEIIS